MPTKQKSKLNKTISTTIEEGQQYLNKCIQISQQVQNINNVLDKTILGDTFDTLKLLPEKSIDLIIVDPPYNLTKNYNNFTFHKRKVDEYTEYTRSWMSLLKPLLKENGTIYICCDYNSSLIVGSVISDFFYIQNRITWERDKGRGAKKNWKNNSEDIWFATNNKDNYIFNLDAVKVRRKVIAPYKKDGVPKDWFETGGKKYRNTCPSNLWTDIVIPFWSMPENTAHPTQKPEKLLAKLILASSNKNDIILDPFLGSGSTSVTAKKLERHYIGIERDPQYCIWSEQRLERAETDKEIQGFKDQIFIKE